MKRIVYGMFALTLIAALAVVSGCCPKCGHKSKMGKEGVYCPAPEGEAVVDYITRENPYQNWDLWPGKGKMYEGQHPHGAYLTTYVSPLAYGAIEDKGGEILDTSFIVKENYTPEKKLAAITVMYKKDGYNPEGGDWFWLKFTPEGKIQKEGKVAGCINCHKSVKDNDWLFTGPI
ncbi:MAG: cytochrome P460 family protein [Desulfuromonadales bacterium]|nr:cytochrome P460 family protein [Desulfuromonadales bacterium]NIR34105.1 cytochrome P460 family protein [Desulfuromonadales bacterium]NIS41561.1 cytochrome P460 family protein [Desulfuromonadales bacterium]